MPVLQECLEEPSLAIPDLFRESLLAAVLVALLCVGQASAADINFIESRDGGGVSVGFSAGFPFTVGVFTTQESAYVAVFTGGAPRPVGVFGTAETGYVAMFTQGAGAPRTAVAALIEPGTMSNPVISDVLFVTRISGRNVSWPFFSTSLATQSTCGVPVGSAPRR